MLGLCVETSYDSSLVALVQDGVVLFQYHFPVSHQSSRFLFSAIQASFVQTGIHIGQLECLVASIGPGSYTGIRVGLAAIKGISETRGLPILPLCSLECMESPSLGRFIAALDAHSGGVYCLEGEKTTQGIHYHGDPKRVSSEEWLGMIDNKSVIISPHAESLKQKSNPVTPNFIEEQSSAHRIAQLLVERRDFMVTSNELYPLYLRKSQPEEEGSCARLT